MASGIFSKQDMAKSLRYLDRELEGYRSPWDAPTLRIVCESPYLSQKLVGSGEEAGSFEYLLDDKDPRGYEYQVNTQGLQYAIEAVRRKANYGPRWFDSTRARKYARYLQREQVFARSIAQDLVLFRGRNIVIYAVCLDVYIGKRLGRWFSAAHMKQFGASEVALIRLANQRRGRPMAREDVIRHCNCLRYADIVHRRPEPEIECLNAKYRKRYGHDGIVARRNKYDNHHHHHNDPNRPPPERAARSAPRPQTRQIRW